VVYDLREEAAKPLLEAGARLARSPAEVARSTDVTLSSLPGPREVEQVALGPGGIVEGIRRGSVYVDLTTSRPSLIRQIASLFRGKGAHVLDAPISGGRQELLQGKQEVTVGGDREVLERVRPVLAAFADQILYAGEIGSGLVCKLVHNMLMRDVMQIIAEGLTLGVKAGVQPEVVWEGIRRGLFGKMMVLHSGVPRTVFRGQFEPTTYTLALSHKDIRLATELAREHGVPLPVSSLVEQIAIQGMNRGWGHKDSGVTFLLQEEMAGVEVRAPGVDPEKAGKYITTHPEAS
jgi:3-hydroxyisobutyrate dehydrogenase